MIEVHSSAEQLGGYFRGLLDDVSAATVEEHCAACPACATRLQDEARLELSLHELVEDARVPVRPRARRSTLRVGVASVAGLVALAAAAVIAFLVSRPQPVAIAKDVPTVASSPSSLAGSDTPSRPAEHRFTLTTGASLHFRVPDVAAFHTDHDAVSVMVSNDDVLVTGNAPGEARILFMTTTGDTLLYVVTVTAQPPR